MAATSLAEWGHVPTAHPLNRTRSDWCSRVGQTGRELQTAIVGLWGDTAPVSSHLSLFVLLYNVISGVHNIRLVFAAWPKELMCNCGCFGRCTFDAAVRVFAWSMEQWLLPMYPAHRHENAPFASSRNLNDKIRAAWNKGTVSWWVYARPRGLAVL